MCYFLTFLFNTQDDSDKAITEFKKESVSAYQVMSDDLNVHNKYAIEISGCFCDSVLLRKRNLNIVDDDFLKKEIHKLKKKGWTESKIEKWIIEKQKNNEKAERITHNKLEYQVNESKYWCEKIKIIFEKLKSKEMYFIIHWCDEGPKISTFHIKDKIVKKITECSEENLWGFNALDIIAISK